MAKYIKSAVSAIVGAASVSLAPVLDAAPPASITGVQNAILVDWLSFSLPVGADLGTVLD